jgi:hypothetical protein
MPLTDLILTSASTSRELQKIRIKIRHVNQDKADEFREVGHGDTVKISRAPIIWGEDFHEMFHGVYVAKPSGSVLFFFHMPEYTPRVPYLRYTLYNGQCVCVCVCVCVYTYIHTYIHRFTTDRHRTLRIPRHLGKSITTR